MLTTDLSRLRGGPPRRDGAHGRRDRPRYASARRRAGADLAFCEMVPAGGLSYANRRTEDLLSRAHQARVGVAALRPPRRHRDMARRVVDLLGDTLAVIDINMDARPARSRPKATGRLCARRKGPRPAEAAAAAVTALESAHASSEDARVPCTGQMYRGAASASGQAVSIPVIGNGGDVVDGASAHDDKQETGCDAFDDNRAARRQPWVFAERQGRAAGAPGLGRPCPLKAHRMRPPSCPPALRVGTRARSCFAQAGSWYCKGLPAPHARGALNRCVTIDDYDRVFDAIRPSAPSAWKAIGDVHSKTLVYTRTVCKQRCAYCDFATRAVRRGRGHKRLCR